MSLTTDGTGGRNWSSPLAYAIVGLTCCVGLTWALRLDQADFRVPFYYTLRGDAFEHAMWLRATADQGSYLVDPRLGSPGQMDLHDYPLSDSVHFALVRLLARCTPDYGAVVNLFYLTGYPLAAWTALFALRRFGLGAGAATVAAVLYAFLPYHFLRGQGHILLSGYYAVPLMAVLLLRIWRRESLFATWPERLFTIVTCVVLPATGVYYAFFGVFLAGVAGMASLSRRASYRVILEIAAVVGLIGGSLAAQLAPSLIYFAKQGRSSEVAKRTAWEAEHFGLKIHQMLMPTLGHRLPQLQRFGIHGVIAPGEYGKISMNDVNENETSSLGAVGVCGFLALVASLFVTRRDRTSGDSLLIPLALLTIASILLASVGGFGAIFSRLVSTQIRAYNRISVYIAFFSLFAVAIGLDRLGRLLGPSARGRVTFSGILGLVLAFGIWDQSPAAMIPDHQREAAAFEADAAFVREIEAEIPDRPAVFQLPYVAFPESLPLHHMKDYDHLWGYFHSDRLRWSYGAIKGRETAEWQRETAALPAVAMVEELRENGFGGLTIDRDGYPDGGTEIEAQIHQMYGVEPLVGPGGRIAFYRLDAPPSALVSSPNSP